MNFTIHLLRDNHLLDAGYVAFATDQNEKVIKSTVGTTIDYSKALLHVSVIFESLAKVYSKATIRFYIESNYESPLSVSCSLDCFAINTENEERYYKELFDLYTTFTITKSEEQALAEIIRRKNLNKNQVERLIQYIQTIKTTTIE